MVALDGTPLVLPPSSPLSPPSRGAHRLTASHRERDADRPRRSGRAPWIVAAVAVLVAAIVLPAKTRVSKAELARVEQRWLTARSVVDQHA